MLNLQSEFAAARPFLEEAWSWRGPAATGTRWPCYVQPRMLTLTLGDIAAARSHLAECLALLRETGRRRVAVFALEGSAVLAEIDGQHEARFVSSPPRRQCAPRWVYQSSVKRG